MPLLKGRSMSLNKPLTDIDPKETIYTIPYTKEQFRSKEEYERQVCVYEEAVWTCQCTGQARLSYQQALESERMLKDALREDFPEVYEKAVLEIVHHSTDLLDVLTDRAWRHVHEVIGVGEPVSLQIGLTGKSIKGTIHKVDKTVVETKPGSTCGSPSSNKENSEDENSQRRRSCTINSPTKAPKKTLPKLLPYKYAIKLTDQDKIVSGIPVSDIVREEEAPVKEVVKTYIRSYAWHSAAGKSSPWIVDADLVKKHGLANKLAGIFLSPTKISDVLKKKPTAEEKKRKRTLSLDKKALAKKQKTLVSKTKDYTKSPKKSSTPQKKSPQKTPKKKSDSAESSDDDLTLAEIKSSPGKSTTSSSQRSAGDGTPKKRGRPTKAEMERRASVQGDNKTPTKKAKDDAKTPASRKKLKQATLFDMKSKKKDGSSTPKKSPSKSPVKNSKQFKMPPLASRLMKAPENNRKKLIERCAREIPVSQIKQLPDVIKEPIMMRYNAIQEKKRVEKMSPAELEEYKAKKKLELKEKMRQIMRKRWKEQNPRRGEDSDLTLDPLPSPALVETPDGVPNALFGDVAMVTEFIGSYKELLTPEDDKSVVHVTTDCLLRSLVADSSGYDPIAKVLVTLLQTLLQDEIAEDYSELDMCLAEIPVNTFTASELVRLCLRRVDASAGAETSSIHSDDGGHGHNDLDLPDELVERLETSELYDFPPEDKVLVLSALCHRLMSSYSVQEYMEEKKNALAELWKQRSAAQKERNDEKKEEKKERISEKQKKMDDKKQKGGDGSETAGAKNKQGVTLDSFYSKPVEEEEPEDDDLVSVVKRRRVMSAKAAEEKRRQDAEERVRRDKEYAQEKRYREREQIEQRFQETMVTSKSVSRRVHLGTDRAHNRYWLFYGTTPGLYVEKGWVTEDVSYSTCPKNAALTDSDSSGSSSDESTAAPEDGRRRRVRRTRKCREKTLPHVGQNLWFVYNNLRDLEQLMKNLSPRGIRESELKSSLEPLKDDIVKSIQRCDSDPKEIEGVDMAESFKEELLDLESRLRAGGLGGVINPDDWETKVDKAKSIQEYGECLVECQQYILEKFLKGMMLKKVKRSKVKGIKLPEEVKEEEPEVDEDADPSDPAPEPLVCIGLLRWRAAIEACPTYSRLHVLMGMLDACVKWEKSAENAKCRICRRKGDEDRLLLCDECNQAYHLYCMRPALYDIPQGEWLCPACVPLSQRKSSRNRREEAEEAGGDTSRSRRAAARDTNYRCLAGMSSDESGEDTPAAPPQPQDPDCARCGGDEDIFPCSSCPASFHLDCHVPPLRREPRSNWRCCQCTSGVQVRPTKAQPRRASKRKAAYEEDDDFDARPRKVQRTAPRSRSGARGRQEPARSSSRPAKRNYKYADYVSSGDSDDDDNEGSDTDEESDFEEEVTAHHARQILAPAPKRSSTTASKSKRGRKSHDKSPANQTLSPSSQHQTRRRGSSHLVNGEFMAQDKLNDNRKVVMDVLKKVRKHKSSWPFMEPVDAELVPDYYVIIRTPMDLQTIENKAISEQYDDPQSFVDDIKTMLDNSFLYNKRDSMVGKCSEQMEKHFISLLTKHLPYCTFPRGGYEAKPIPQTPPREEEESEESSEEEEEREEEESSGEEEDDVSEDGAGPPGKSRAVLSDHAYYSPNRTSRR